MTETNQNITMWAGDTKQILVTVTDDDGDPKNLGGATIRWILTTRASAHIILDKDNGKAGGLTVTDPGGGVFRVDLDPEDTEDLPPRSYYHEAEVADAGGNISTVLIGTVTIQPSAA